MKIKNGEVWFSSGRRLAAAGDVVGIDPAGVVYGGYATTLEVGPLFMTPEERIELGTHMSTEWRKFTKRAALQLRLKTSLWMAVCQDRHLDADLSIHKTREEAIDYARAYMRAHVARPDDLIESDSPGRWDIESSHDDSDNAYVIYAEVDL